MEEQGGRWKNAATSVLISRTIDNIGYGLQMVRLRREKYNQLTENETNETVTIIVSGSKAEGLSKVCESYLDILTTSSDFICTTIPQSIISTYQHTIFQMDISETCPGYARLLHDGPVNDDDIHSVMYSIGGLTYLPRDKWRTMKKQNLPPENSEIEVSLEFSGPSCPIVVHHQHYQESVDFVEGIHCICPDILRIRMARKRNDFPSADVIHEISNMEAHAVPVGYKESEWQFLEWRICFNKAEIRLVQSLNDCQTKLLILLRKIAKRCLKSICNEMSSYIMKNIVLWMSERMPGNYFIEGNLFQALETSLKLLRSCLIRKPLPSYMVAERNLLAGRVTLHERAELCQEIDSLLREGPCVVLRWNHVSSALNRLYRSPDTYCNLSNTFILSELLCISYTMQREENQLKLKMKEALEKAILSVYPELHIRHSDKILPHLLKVFLS